ncbi:MAG: hypothetical protein M3O30_18960 [Planctomycetota bacterium]|nr:hypothetical protein [Planctomycetota bacterium]
MFYFEPIEARRGKRRMRGVFALASVVLCICGLGRSLQASPITLTATGRGFINNSGSGNGIASDNNYILNYFSYYRDFFIFDLSGLTGKTINSATLQIDGTSDFVLRGGDSANFYNVTDSIATLGSDGVSNYNGLNGSTLYGGHTYTSSDANTTQSISLDAAFIGDATAAIGGKIAIGGSMNAPHFDDYLFGSSQGLSFKTQLLLDVSPRISTPLPSTAYAGVGLLGGLGLLQFVRSRRNVAE